MNIKRSFLKTFILSSLLFIAGCSCKKSKKAGLLVVNVLDKELYDDCHIKGSINVPFDEIENYAKNLDKNTEVVLYCSNYRCTASGFAAKSLTKLGFKNVWAYEAGMAEWYQNKLPVEGACKESYLQIKVPEYKNEEIRVITTQELKNKIESCGAAA
jgi:rhodanese-related sulfurtransferase